MFTKSAEYYDDIYASAGKDYVREAAKTHKLIQKYVKSGGKSLLDVGCGTGQHVSLLRKYYQVEGLDLDPNILLIARKKYGKIRFHKGDMVNFKLNKKFDVILCLFSSIGYVRTKTRLEKAIRNMYLHLEPGGVLLVEPWFTPKEWHAGRVFTLSVNKPNLKIVRMSRSLLRGKLSVIEFQYLIGSPGGIEHVSEYHQLGLFTRSEYLNAFVSNGVKVVHDASGLDGRGLYIGIKS